MTRAAEDILIVMSRLPRAGRSKTRLIPTLGPEGAADLHDRLARHAIGRASSFVLTRSRTSLRIHVEGGSTPEAKNWLGGGDCRIQQPGDLGQRLASATAEAFADGARRVVVIGTDCPSLEKDRLVEAFQRLETCDLVFGPALDGGYYLIGMSRPCPAVFENIDWGGPKVLDQSLAAVRRAGAPAFLLDPLSDVDLPDDLPAAEAALASGSSVSVIVPTLDEECHIEPLLDRLLAARPHQILIADGGSADRTRALADRPGVEILDAPKGRATQMNHAAAQATGEFLLFLHADTLPPPEFPTVIPRVLNAPGTSAGAFRFRLDDALPAAPLIEALVGLRCRLRQLPYGDQGLFLRRSVFRHLGGFPEWPVMEDLHLVRCLRDLGKIQLAHPPCHTSARRWTNHGTIRTFVRHQLMIAAYHLGVPPARITRLRPAAQLRNHHAPIRKS